MVVPLLSPLPSLFLSSPPHLSFLSSPSVLSLSPHLSLLFSSFPNILLHPLSCSPPTPPPSLPRRYPSPRLYTLPSHRSLPYTLSSLLFSPSSLSPTMYLLPSHSLPSSPTQSSFHPLLLLPSHSLNYPRLLLTCFSPLYLPPIPSLSPPFSSLLLTLLPYTISPLTLRPCPNSPLSPRFEP